MKINGNVYILTKHNVVSCRLTAADSKQKLNMATWHNILSALFE